MILGNLNESTKQKIVKKLRELKSIKSKQNKSEYEYFIAHTREVKKQVCIASLAYTQPRIKTKHYRLILVK